MLAGVKPRGLTWRTTHAVGSAKEPDKAGGSDAKPATHCGWRMKRHSKGRSMLDEAEQSEIEKAAIDFDATRELAERRGFDFRQWAGGARLDGPGRTVHFGEVLAAKNYLSKPAPVLNYALLGRRENLTGFSQASHDPAAPRVSAHQAIQQ